MANPASVQIKEINTKKGKGLFATRDVSEGDELFEEEPLVACQFLWNAFYKYRACDLCMKSLETAEHMAQRLSANASLVLPHAECCGVTPQRHATCQHCGALYCSPECKDKAWDAHHRTLCLGAAVRDEEHAINKMQEFWKNIHYPPETGSVMLLARLVAMVKQSQNKAELIETVSRFCSSTINDEEAIAHKLLGSQFNDQLEYLRHAMTEALFDEHIVQWFTPEGFKSLFALFGTNGQGIGTSSFSTWVNKVEALELPENEKQELDKSLNDICDEIEKEAGQFQNCEGSGLYCLQSACNHSCDPNSEITFPRNDFTLVLKALKNIKQGEEITISYLDECFQDRSCHTRNRYLRENYLFTCDCLKCLSQADDPDITSSEESESDMDNT